MEKFLSDSLDYFFFAHSYLLCALLLTSWWRQWDVLPTPRHTERLTSSTHARLSSGMRGAVTVNDYLRPNVSTGHKGLQAYLLRCTPFSVYIIQVFSLYRRIYDCSSSSSQTGAANDRYYNFNVANSVEGRLPCLDHDVHRHIIVLFTEKMTFLGFYVFHNVCISFY